MLEPSMQRFLQFFERTACDELYITAGDVVSVRLQGNIVRCETKRLTSHDTAKLMRSVTPESNQQQLENDGSTDFYLTHSDDLRFHVAVFNEPESVRIVVRKISGMG